MTLFFCMKKAYLLDMLVNFFFFFKITELGYNSDSCESLQMYMVTVHNFSD